MIKSLPILLILTLLTACASSKKIELEGANEPNPDFQRGLRALEKEDFSQAATAFDRLLVARPATEMDLLTTYNSGSAYEGMGQCSRAAERYREVVRSSMGKYARLEALALFRLSLMYECLGNDNKTITALLDAHKRGKELPVEVDRAELPARLAAAYARMGNRAKALEYFNQASDGLKAVLGNGTTARAQKETLSRTLYYMGHLNPAQKQGDADPNGFLQSLSMQQPYLLQAVEMQTNPWSRKAADDLASAYDTMVRFRIAEPDKRSQYYTRSLQVIAELRKIRLPDGGAKEDEIFAKVDRTERRIQSELASVAATTKLTPDAEKREGVMREGRLVDPKPPKRIKK